MTISTASFQERSQTGTGFRKASSKHHRPMYFGWVCGSTCCRQMLDTSASGQIGTRTLRYQDKSAPGQFGIPIRQIGTCVFFFDFTSFDCYRMYFTSLFFFLKSCFDLFDKSITLSNFLNMACTRFRKWYRF